MTRTSTFLALILGLAVHGAHGCGIDWSLPKNHFDGVNEFGFVSIWENLGRIPLGGGLDLPLNANFRSDRTTPSSTLGSGWRLALLDANIVQIDERTFMMFDPAGPFRLFWRDPKNPNILSGQGGWKAEIRGDLITAWASCGTKLVFNKGRIAEIQILDRKFEYVYSGEALSEVREGAIPILKVISDPGTKEVVGITINLDNKILLEREKRPRVKGGAINTIEALESALSKVVKTDGTSSTFAYGLDKNLNPTLTIGNRVISWDATTKTILNDGDWNYRIEKPQDLSGNAEIDRKNPNGETEYWHFDATNGEETTKKNGATTVMNWFTSGSLAGKTRSVKVTKAGVTKTVYQASYSEDGKQIREQNFDWKKQLVNPKGQKVPVDADQIASVFNLENKETKYSRVEIKLKNGVIIFKEKKGTGENHITISGYALYTPRYHLL